MSKQSRAKSRARRRARGTGAAPMYVTNFSLMCDANQFWTRKTLFDQLHHVLDDHRVFKDEKFRELFRSNFWASLEHELAMHHSTSPKRLIALDLVVKIRSTK